MRAPARKVFSSYLEPPVVRLLIKLGASPNIVTLLGLPVAGASAYLLSTGRLWAGGSVLLASGIFDMFDGALARATGRASSFGAILDSATDRVSESVALLGLLIFFAHRASTEGTVLVFVTLVGSFMVSYVRARAEGLGVACEVGLMTRPERVAALGLGMIAGHWSLTVLLAVLATVAALATATSVQRMLHVWRVLAKRR